MEKLSFNSSMPAEAVEVYRWHERPAALARLTPPWSSVELASHGGLEVGSRAKLKLGFGPLSLRWVAEHTDVRPGEGFTDEQVHGPFRRWKHVHRMVDAEKGSRLFDEIEYELPLSPVTRRLAGGSIRRQLSRQFAYRHRTLANDLALHDLYGRDKLRIAVSGSRGLIGRALVGFLESGGHEVIHIVRHEPTDADREIYWNHREDRLEVKKLQGTDVVVHLAGENVLVPRWSEQKKMEILGSRVRGTEHLAQQLASLDDPPGALLSASAIGYYGHRGGEELDEKSDPGDDGFLSAVCQEWEKATAPALEAGIRTVQMRIGIVLTPTGGILPALLLPFRMGLGGRYGGRDQYLSWIGLDEAIGQIYHLMHDEQISGPVNLTAPNPVTMAEFGRTLARVLSRPAFVRLPPSVLRAFLGEVAEEAALMSVRVLPGRLTTAGYRFLHPNLEGLLRHVLGRTLEPFSGAAVHRRRTQSTRPADPSETAA